MYHEQTHFYSYHVSFAWAVVITIGCPIGGPNDPGPEYGPECVTNPWTYGWAVAHSYYVAI
jgi:hypothetical protein